MSDRLFSILTANSNEIVIFMHKVIEVFAIKREENDYLSRIEKYMQHKYCIITLFLFYSLKIGDKILQVII